jgi:2-haloacid dehalogenase
MPNVALAFDVNETLLDLKSLDPHFERVFGDTSLRVMWFGLMLQLSFGGIATGRYLDFPSAQRAALQMVARRRGMTVSDDAVDQIVGAMSQLTPHPEVRDALAKLRKAGFKMSTLTNSPADVAVAQVENAGIRDLFDDVISADDVRRLKPAPEPYLHAAQRMGVAPGKLRLIAAHWWDIDGALAAGCLGAFVERPGATLNPSAPAPDVKGSDLQQVASQILERDC